MSCGISVESLWIQRFSDDTLRAHGKFSAQSFALRAVNKMTTLAERFAVAAASAVSYSAGWMVCPCESDETHIVSLRSVRNVDSDSSESYLQHHRTTSDGTSMYSIAPVVQVCGGFCRSQIRSVRYRRNYRIFARIATRCRLSKQP